MLIDTHCHLPSLKYRNKIIFILREAKEAGVEKLINVGASLKGNQEAIKTEAFENVYVAIGVHPNEDRGKNIGLIATELKKQIKSGQKIVAIGECGLDITNWEHQRPLNEQIKLFEIHLQLARKYHLPIIIHNRNGDEKIISLLKKYKDLKGVFHCFCSTWQFAQQILKLNFYLSFSGFITYLSKSYLLETVAKVPADKFVIETDSPLITPKPCQDEQNQPKNVKIIAEKVAQIRGDSFLSVANYTTQNAQELFNL